MPANSDPKPVNIPKPIRDAAYVAVGFGVLGFQRAQVRRREVEKRLGHRTDLGAGLEAARVQLTDLVRGLDQWAAPVRRDLDGRLDGIEHRLPDPARRHLHTVRDVARGTEAQVRHIVGI